MAIKKEIAERVKGAAPLSIPTSLALESLCGFGEHPNDKPYIHEIEELWVNLRTVFRNLYNSVDTYVRETSNAEHFIDAIVEDMQVLTTVIENKSQGRVKVIFYHCSYKSFKKTFPYAKWKELKTDKQKIEQKLEDTVLDYFLKHKELQDNFDIKKFDVKILGHKVAACMLTHYPTDLLSGDSFHKLRLLESHTGAIKPKAHWYTKLTGGPERTRLPFNRLTVQVMGDKNVLFSILSRQSKEALIEMSEKNKWTSVTTDAKIRMNITKLEDSDMKHTFMNLL